MKLIVTTMLIVIATSSLTFSQRKQKKLSSQPTPQQKKTSPTPKQEEPSPLTAPSDEQLVEWGAFTPIFDPLMGIIGAAKRKYILDSRISALLTDIADDTMYLHDKWMSAKAEPSPAIYKSALEVNKSLLEEVVNKGLSAEKALPILQDVRDDLRVKAEECKKSSRGWDSLIELTIITVKDLQPVSGYEVWFVPKGWADRPEKWERFPKLSSPSIKRLAPGRYMFRLKKEVEARAEPVTVGGEGKPRMEQDMRVP